MKITIEQLDIPLWVKEKITKIPKISKLHLEFINVKIFILIKLTFLFMNHIK